MLERELRLNATAGFSFPDLSMPGFDVVGAQNRHRDAVYYDTADLRLARWGCWLRHRTDEGWTVRLSAVRVGDDVQPREVRLAGHRGAIPLEARDLVRVFARRAPLIRVARLRAMRRPVLLIDRRGEQAAEVVEEDIAAYHGEGPARRFREVEIELSEEADAAVLDQLVAKLSQAGAGAESPTSWLARALGPDVMKPPDVVVPELDSAPAGADVIRSALSASVHRFIVNISGVYLDEDPEPLHQARVATRRLRSDLRTFGELIDPRWAGSLRADLRGLGTALGAVRDADVLLLRLQSTTRRLPEVEAEAAQVLIRALEGDRTARRRGLAAWLRGDGYVALLDRMVDAAMRPVLRSEAIRPARATLAPRVDQPLGDLLDAVDGLRAHPTDAELHRIRILTKRVRYAAEAVAPVFGEDARRFAEAASRVQDTLGELQDAVVARGWLRDAAEAHPQAAFVAGELAGFELQRAEEAREHWPDLWRRLSRKKLRKWL